MGFRRLSTDSSPIDYFTSTPSLRQHDSAPVIQYHPKPLPHLSLLFLSRLDDIYLFQNINTVYLNILYPDVAQV